MAKSRTYNSVLNSLIGIVASIVTVLLNFAVRVVLVRELGDEINGLHNLFLSITNAITLIEAGFSTAMVIHLYKPLVEQDHDLTAAIMVFYKKVYSIIALLFVVICVIVDLFFIEYLVESSIPLYKVRLFFAIYMLITPLGYLTYYKLSILFAEQKNRIYSISLMACQLIFRSMQILSVYLTHDYYVFLVLMIVEKVSANLMASRYVDKKHPYLKNKCTNFLSETQKNSIYKTVRPIFVNNIASNIQASAKGILIGLLLGNVSIVGYFGNYQLVTSTATLLFAQFGGAFTSSFGNLAVQGDKENMYNAYRKTIFILDWIAIFVCACFLCCIQPFISFFFGESLLLSNVVVLIIAIDLFVYLMKVPIISVQNAIGLHYLDQRMMLLQAFLAVIFGYFGGKYYDLSGLLIGLLIPQFIFTLIYKGVVINKCAFGKSWQSFALIILQEFCKVVIVSSVCLYVTSFIETSNLLLDFIVRGFMVLFITALLFFVLSRRSPYFSSTIAFVTSLINRKRK